MPHPESLTLDAVFLWSVGRELSSVCTFRRAVPPRISGLDCIGVMDAVRLELSECRFRL